VCQAALNDSELNSDKPDSKSTKETRITTNELVKLYEREETQRLLTALGVGVLTGAAVVVFNVFIHGIHDISYGDVDLAGASATNDYIVGKAWLEYDQFYDTLPKVLLLPILGGVGVSLLKQLNGDFDPPGSDPKEKPAWQNPLVRASCAVVTLGTGNSLGPEGPSVEIGTSMAKIFSRDIRKNAVPQSPKGLALLACGSGAGVAAGFNAVVGGAFFAVETVLQRATSGTDGKSVGGTTSEMVLLAAISAQTISRIGLGDSPAFHTPTFDIVSLAELPLYLPLGALCGFYALWFNSASKYANDLFTYFEKDVGIPKSVHPPLGGLSTGLIALCFPEVLYNGFSNVDALLQEGITLHYGIPLLVQIIIAKLVATAVCRGSGLVGGIYAPSLMAGAAIGSAYGQLLSIVLGNQLVAYPQAYSLVGMAATLASVCDVPLTAVLLIFELSENYQIIIPLMLAVSIASAAARIKPGEPKYKKEATEEREVEDQLCVVGGPVVDIACQLEAESTNELTVLERLCVIDTMDAPCTIVQNTQTVAEAAEELVSSRCAAAVVMGSPGDQKVLPMVVGTVTLSDLQSRMAMSQAAARTTLANAITANNLTVCAATVQPSDSLLTARFMLDQADANFITVVDQEGEVAGLLSRDSIVLSSQLEEVETTLRNLEQAEIKSPRVTEDAKVIVDTTSMKAD